MSEFSPDHLSAVELTLDNFFKHLQGAVSSSVDVVEKQSTDSIAVMIVRQCISSLSTLPSV